VAKPAPRSTIVVYAPAGARVDVDGSAVASSGAPLKVDVTGGEHRVVVTAPRRQPFDQQVTVAAGATAEVRAKLQHLQKGAPKGADTVVTTPPVASPPPPPGTPPAATATATPETKPDSKAADGKPEGKTEKKTTGDYTLDPF